MFRHLAAALGLLVALSACVPDTPTLGSDGKPVPKVYRIRGFETARIQYNMLDSVNALRLASGLQELSLDPALNAAAATHSQDMALQNRPWHFGSDGSSPIERVQRVGFDGRLLGENISETYETELETLAAWMDRPDTQRVILSPEARRMGFAWYQEDNGKIWWTLVVGT